MYDAKQVWEQIAVQPGFTLFYPNEFLVRFLSKYVRQRALPTPYGTPLAISKHPTTRLLDLGCGSGRHVVMLAREGFTVFGLDISAYAITLVETWLKSEGLTAELQVGTATALPYPDRHFQVIVSHGCLDHMTRADAEKAVAECRRVLSDGGLLYCDLISKLESGFEHGPMLERDTFIVPAGEEAGAIQRFYDLDSLRALLEPHFDLLDVVLSQWEPVLGQGLSNLDKNGAPYPRASRYHIAARKA